MCPRAARLRLFVAIYPPGEVAEALLGALGSLELPPHRPVPAEQVHLTVQFVGSVAASDLARTVETVDRARGGLEAFALTPQRLVSLPERGRARLVAAEADAPPALLELQRRLAGRLARPPRRRPGDRFRPHLTLCRFRSPASMPRVDAPLDAPAFAVSEVRLMKSALLPQGARHEVVGAFSFAGDP